MKLQEGKKYVSREGKKSGSVWQEGSVFTDGDEFWWPDGLKNREGSHPGDLIAEWIEEPTSPIRTRTIKEVMTGVYGRVSIDRTISGGVLVAICRENLSEPSSDRHYSLSRVELLSASKVLAEIADALEGE